MEKELTNVFKGKAPNNLNQTKTIINKEEKIEDKKAEIKSVNKQIKDIFDSDKFLYKAETLITLTSGDKIKKTIIGKTNNSLITLDDDLIDVSNISQIELI